MNKMTRKFLIGTASMFMLGAVLVSCGKDSDNTTVTPPTPLGGYTSSDDVASANLVAYFPMDGNANDTKGGSTATTVGATFTTGIRGQAFQGDSSGTYATMAPSAALANLPSYSFSVWYKLAKQPSDGNPDGMFFLSGPTDQHELIYEIEHYAPLSNDSVRVHHGFSDFGGTGPYKDFTMEAFNTAAVAKWVLFTTTYDGATSTYTVYQNGVSIGNNSAFGQNVNPTHLLTDQPTSTPAGVPLGNLSFAGDLPNQIIIGTWPAGLYGVSPTLGARGGFRGQLDEIRIFNKALTAAEVNGLYLNGNAGR